jgi:hypothetical protein
LFRDWQRTLTQSSATALVARGSKWMSGSARAGTTSREAYVRTTKPDITHCAFSRTRPGHLCSPLTKDSHGRRQYGGFGPVVVARRQAPRVISVLPVIRPEPRPITGPLRIADNPSGLGKSDANLAQRQPRPQVGSSENSAVAAFAIGAVESHRVTRTHFFRRRVPL